MIKRATALFFVLIASIFFLANAVIPHHHHKDEVCIESSHCDTDCESHEHETTNKNHKHNGNNDFQCCVLKQEVILPSNLIKQEIKSFNYLENLSYIDCFQAEIYNQDLIKHIQTNTSNSLNHLIPSLYSRSVCNGIGMRAPPIV